MHITSEIETLTFETKTLELLKPKVHICNFIFKFPVDCDAMMHVLKDSIIQKLSKLLTNVILSES